MRLKTIHLSPGAGWMKFVFVSHFLYCQYVISHFHLLSLKKRNLSYYQHILCHGSRIHNPESRLAYSVVHQRHKSYRRQLRWPVVGEIRHAIHSSITVKIKLWVYSTNDLFFQCDSFVRLSNLLQSLETRRVFKKYCHFRKDSWFCTWLLRFQFLSTFSFYLYFSLFLFFFTSPDSLYWSQ